MSGMDQTSVGINRTSALIHRITAREDRTGEGKEDWKHRGESDSLFLAHVSAEDLRVTEWTNWAWRVIGTGAAVVTMTVTSDGIAWWWRGRRCGGVC
jgi:hypothetical protein